MILSNVSIHEALEKGWLVIEPEPAPKTLTDGYKCPYQTSSVDLLLGNEIAYFKPDLSMAIDLRKGNFPTLFGNNSESVEISKERAFTLNPGEFVLARTHEKVTLPILGEGQTSLAARVEGKSSYARCGLLVHFTASTIHSGFSGAITLELINLGRFTINLYAESPICQLIIEQVHGIPFPNPSQFQGQTKSGGSK